jgi:hypothetical protein
VSVEWKVDLRLRRLAIALVWLYQGLWCKVLSSNPHHLSIISAVPLIGVSAGRTVMVLLGLIECGIGVWVLTGARMRSAAIVQTLLVAAMNVCGGIWARNLIPDPAGMILQNFAFVLLIWTTAEDRFHVANT